MRKRLLGVMHVLPWALTLALAPVSSAQVLGACGTPQENDPVAATEMGTSTQGVLLPGRHAINFELPGVVGDEITTVKLSDYNGKWRVLCFYPADFTFV